MKSILFALLALALQAQTIDLDKEIEKIFQSPLNERRVLMNELKERIRHINHERQIQIINKLRAHTKKQMHKHQKGEKFKKRFEGK